MVKYIIEASINNRFLVTGISLLVALFGIWAVTQTPVDAIPDLSDVQVIIKTDFSGQGPQIVEEQVTYPLSSAMLSVPFATAVRGYSMFGTSFVYVIFEDGTDMYWARSRVLEYLNQVGDSLPDGVSPTLGPDATGVGWVLQYSLLDKSGNHDLSELRSIQDFFLTYELQSVEGVAEIATVGGFERQYQIVVDPQRLAGYGLSLKHIAMQLRESNADVGGRVVELGDREFIVRGKGYLRGMEDIKTIPLATSNGSSITVNDVADVRMGPELRRGIAERNGEGEVVGGIVVMRYGENALRVIDDVKDRLEELSAGLPDGVEVVIDYDRSALIQRAVSTLKTKLWQELLVVAMIVMLFLLHVRSAFVAVVTVPVGVLAAFLLMNALGMNANIMSLGGIAIAIGVMVDASLVLVENAHKHIERQSASLERRQTSQERIAAIKSAAVEVGPSLFFSLLIVTVSFLPVFTLEQVEGRLFRPLAFTKTFAMGAASILAITLVPALMTFFVKGRIRSESTNPISRGMITVYRPIIEFSLKYPKTVLVWSVLVLATTILPIQQLITGRTIIPFEQMGSEFMPDLDEGDLLYMPTTLPGVSSQQAKNLLQQTDRIIKSFPEVKSVFGKAGRANTATDPAPMSMFETTISLRPKDEWREGLTKADLISQMDEAVDIPGLTNMWTMPIKTRTDMLATGIKTPVGIKIAGQDLRVLERIGREIELALTDLDGTQSVFAERSVGGSYLDFDVDRKQAARYGLTVGDVQQVIASAVGGMNITNTIEGLERYPVNIRYGQAFRSSPQQMESILILTEDGSQIPMGQVAQVSLHDGPTMIKSENARPNSWVFVDLESGQDIGGFVERAKAVIAEQVDLPAGYSLRWSGQFESMERANNRLKILIPFTIAIIFLLLMIHLQHAAESAMILLTVPFSLIGGVWLITLLGFDMSIATAVGFIAVAGLAAETGVVMLVYLREAMNRYRSEERLKNHEDVRNAVIEGALLRVRPLLMTVITTLLALLPIMFGTETGAEVMKRIAAPMVGGLVSAAFMTLIIIPVVFLLINRRQLGSRTRTQLDID